MGRLVAIVARGGDRFVAALRATWDAGDAVLPLDPRLPAPTRDALLSSVRPAVLLDPLGDGPSAATAGSLLDRSAPATGPDDALVVATSGTTAAPKGVVLTHAAVAAHARAVHARLGVGPSDRWLACLPLAHLGGLGVVVRALVDGVALEVHDGFDTAAVTDARRRGATLTSLVPTALDRVGSEGFRWVVLGGSADTRPERPANVVRTWGMTETGGGVVYDGTPLEGVEVTGVDGQLWVRSPTLARGVRAPDGSVSDRRRPLPAASGEPSSALWLPTGDAGSVAADGTVEVTGRLDEVIVTGGEKVWPEAVEAALRSVPGIAEAGVAGRRDPEWGQRVVAWIVAEPGAGPPSLEDVRAAVAEVLPPWCAPIELHLVADLPRTPLGKVRRAALRADPRA